MTLSTRALRALFSITPREVTGYDVACLVDDCGWTSKAWDYRRNALGVGYRHALAHDGQPFALLELRDERDSLKMLRETLASAQSALLAQLPVPMHEADRGVRIAIDAERLGRLIAEIDRQRPLGPDGKHGDLHTPTCGCEDR